VAGIDLVGGGVAGRRGATAPGYGPEAVGRFRRRLVRAAGVSCRVDGDAQRVEAAQYRVVGADVLADAVAVHVQRVAGMGVPVLGARLHGAQVVVAAQPGQAGVVLVQVLDLGQVHPGDPGEVEHQGGIDVAGAAAHHQALQRGHAHQGGVEHQRRRVSYRYPHHRPPRCPNPGSRVTRSRR
jgi:hypothetical protein